MAEHVPSPCIIIARRYRYFQMRTAGTTQYEGVPKVMACRIYSNPGPQTLNPCNYEYIIWM